MAVVSPALSCCFPVSKPAVYHGPRSSFPISKSQKALDKYLFSDRHMGLNDPGWSSSHSHSSAASGKSVLLSEPVWRVDTEVYSDDPVRLQKQKLTAKGLILKWGKGHMQTLLPHLQETRKQELTGHRDSHLPSQHWGGWGQPWLHKNSRLAWATQKDPPCLKERG